MSDEFYDDEPDDCLHEELTPEDSEFRRYCVYCGEWVPNSTAPDHLQEPAGGWRNWSTR